MGMNDLIVKMALATANVFLQHYGSNSTFEVTLHAMLENLQLELGVQGYPLEYNFDQWGGMAMDSWIKAFWK